MKKPYLNIPRGTVRLPQRPTPRALGLIAGSAGQGLRAMPYGPGERQDAYMLGYRQGYIEALQTAMDPADAREISGA